MSAPAIFTIATLAGIGSALFYIYDPGIHQHPIALSVFNFIFWFIASWRLTA